MGILPVLMLFIATGSICYCGEILSSKANLGQLFTYVRTENKTDILGYYISQKRSQLDLYAMLTGTPDFMNSTSFSLDKPMCMFQYVFMLTEGRPGFNPHLKPLTLSYTKAVLMSHLKHLPDEMDLVHAGKGILHAQDVHQLPTADMAEGWFMGIKSRSLYLTERFQLAAYLSGMEFNTKFGNAPLAQRSLQWLIQAKELMQTREDVDQLYSPFRSVLEAMGCNCSQFALDLVREFQKYDANISMPNDCHEKAPESCRHYDEKFQKAYPHDNFVAICRGEQVYIADDINVVTPQRKLFCKYVDNGDPRLILAPMKVEELNHNYPRIMLLHDVISETENNALKATKLLQQVNPKIHGNFTYYIRKGNQCFNITKNNWTRGITDFHSRLSALTNLHQRSFGNITVSNFGFAGNERIHLDAHFPLYNVSYPNEMENPIASVMIFLSDVIQGGEEVFPHLGIKVEPVKNSALVYYNLYKNGIINVFSLHGSCPVIRGEKWTAFQMIMNYGQEFTYPCDLDKME